MSTIPKDEIGKLAEDCWNKRKEKGETEFAEPVDYMVGFIDGYQLATDGLNVVIDNQVKQINNLYLEIEAKQTLIEKYVKG